jgi:RHS repeat-associated protein
VLGKMKAQAAAFGPTETLLSSTSYYYNGSGNVTLMSTSVANPAEGEPNYFETVFSYARNEKAVTAISGTTPGSGGNPPTSFARGFRYDAARERYRNNETWSDYDQDWIYGDYLVDPTTGEVTEKRAYMPGIARVEDIDAPGTPPVRYYHTDMLGTTRFVTTLSGQPTDETVYTAFGEKVCSLPGGDCTNTTDHRYGYAGAFGYQSTINDTTGVADFPFLHVGARYYDPAIGRFLQRDPIGIEGGLNVYAYVRNGPTKRIDPSGLSTNNPGGAGSHTPGGMKEVIETVKDMGDFGGRKINGYTKHAINQAICRGGKGVATKAILEAIKSGVWQAGKNGTAKYVGKFATLIMRGDGTIITVYATCAEGARIKGG